MSDLERRCMTCHSKGFAMSILSPMKCEYCDGTFGGNPPTVEDIEEERLRVSILQPKGLS